MKQRPAPASPISRRILFIGNFVHLSTKPIVAGVVRFLSAHPEVALFIHGDHPGPDEQTDGLDSDVDGVVSCLGSYETKVRRLVARKRRIPFVFVCAPCKSPSLRRRSATLLCDDASIAETVAALLVRHGLTEFGYVGSQLEAEVSNWDIARREAFMRYLGERGFPVHFYEPEARRPGTKAEFAELAAWLRALPKPCGLFVAYDQRAMQVLTICRAEGIAVPEQIQIVSVDNEGWICDNTSPSLTSVEPDFEGAGYRAAELLLDMINNAQCTMHNAQCAGDVGGQTETFGVRRIVERMSTTDTHGSMNRAVRARDFIRRNAGEPITVAMLAKRLGCSLRTLQTSYKAVFGTTVWEDIAEAKLEKAKQLLVESRAPLGEIPGLVGFDSAPYFTRFFKRRTGMSMREWRHAGQTAQPSSRALR